jgi:hypothetical protein
VRFPFGAGAAPGGTVGGTAAAHGRRRFLRLAGCLGGAALVAAPPTLLAHRSPGTTTTVHWNARADSLEIVHRLHVHDAVRGVERITGAGPLRITEIEDRARVALTVEAQFEIELDGEPVPIRTLGAQLTGDYVLVLQESDRRLQPGRIRVRNEILREAFPGQINEVFLRDGEAVETLRFTPGDRWLPASLGG